MGLKSGAFRLFRLAGIDVYLHWTWLLVAFFQVQFRSEVRGYDRPVWNWIEYLSLFAIVLMHEFGHALACRQVGGFANQIVLWPLGGIAFVNPPPRPGAVLWSIAAGPLVNVLLVPVTAGLWIVSSQLDWAASYPDLAQYVQMMFAMNLILLIFNLLPIYPLDGGQILQALLWFVIGRAHSLMVVSIIGLIGSGVLLLVAVLGGWGNWLLFAMAIFAALRAIAGLQQARFLARLLSGPRHREASCPHCGTAPLAGNYWRCDECGQAFDTFRDRARCPNCSKLFKMTRCPDCYHQYPIDEWINTVLPADEPHHYAPY